MCVANISLIIHGKSLSTCPGGELKPSQTWVVTRYYSGKIYLKIFPIPRAYYIHSQLRSAWISAQGVCSMPDYDSNKVTIIFMVINNSFLLVVMVIGLLRMRIHGAGTCSLGQLLWKQVRWKWFCMAAMVLLHSLM
jgi:hypothetical protein